MSKRDGEPFDDWKAARDQSAVARIQGAEKRLPLTKNHQAYQAAIPVHQVVMCWGPAGTGKTTLAGDVAVKLFKAGRVRKIVLTRPIVACGSPIGFLPGTEREKMAPYIAPLEKAVKPFFSPVEYENLIAKEIITIRALETLRGETFNSTIAILDEAQNASSEQLKMFLTRLGHDSYLVVNGDVTQADIRAGKDNPLGKAIRALRGNPDIHIQRFVRADCLRPPLVQWMDEKLSS